MGSKSYSKGVSWFSDCRIPFVDEGDKGSAKPQGKTTVIRNVLFNPSNDLVRSELETTQGQGRFPANILVSDDMLNDGVISRSGNNKIRSSDGFNKNAYGIGIGVKVGDNNGEYGDKGSNSRYYDIDKWFDKILDV